MPKSAELSFFDQGTHKSVIYLKGLFIDGYSTNKWIKRKNQITLFDETRPEGSITFQYAIDKGIFKLLKKEDSGRIQIFAFFERVQKKGGNQNDASTKCIERVFIFLELQGFNITPTTAPSPIPANEKFPQ